MTHSFTYKLPTQLYDIDELLAPIEDAFGISDSTWRKGDKLIERWNWDWENLSSFRDTETVRLFFMSEEDATFARLLLP